MGREIEALILVIGKYRADYSTNGHRISGVGHSRGSLGRSLICQVKRLRPWDLYLVLIYIPLIPRLISVFCI